MIPGVNPKQMQQMMRQLGIQQVELGAIQAIIRLNGGQELVIDKPQVTKVNMMGQQTYQIVGNAYERASEVPNEEPEISSEDIDTVAEQTGVSKDQAKQALIKSEGDLARAILSLK